jgi:hypothetical protein
MNVLQEPHSVKSQKMALYKQEYIENLSKGEIYLNREVNSDNLTIQRKL